MRQVERMSNKRLLQSRWAVRLARFACGHHISAQQNRRDVRWLGSHASGRNLETYAHDGLDADAHELRGYGAG